MYQKYYKHVLLRLLCGVRRQLQRKMRKDTSAGRSPQKDSEKNEKKAPAEKDGQIKRKLMRQLSFFDRYNYYSAEKFLTEGKRRNASVFCMVDIEKFVLSVRMLIRYFRIYKKLYI